MNEAGKPQQTNNETLHSLKPTPKVREFRDLMIAMILATDMSAHVPLLTSVHAKIEAKRSAQEWFSPNIPQVCMLSC